MLFALVTVLGLACAALANANSWWWSVVYTVSFLSIVVSGVTAVFGQGATRAFAGGVVLTTILYSYHFVVPHLLSDRLLTWIQLELWPIMEPMDVEYKDYFNLIWWTLWGAPFTLFGGFVARFVYLKRAADPRPATSL